MYKMNVKNVFHVIVNLVANYNKFDEYLVLIVFLKKATAKSVSGSAN